MWLSPHLCPRAAIPHVARVCVPCPCAASTAVVGAVLPTPPAPSIGKQILNSNVISQEDKNLTKLTLRQRCHTQNSPHPSGRRSPGPSVFCSSVACRIPRSHRGAPACLRAAWGPGVTHAPSAQAGGWRGSSLRGSRGPPPPLLLSGAGRAPGGGTPGDSCAYPHTVRLYGGFTPYHLVKSQHTFRPFLSFAIKHTGAVNIYVGFCCVPGGGGNIRPHRCPSLPAPCSVAKFRHVFTSWGKVCKALLGYGGCLSTSLKGSLFPFW